MPQAFDAQNPPFDRLTHGETAELRAKLDGVVEHTQTIAGNFKDTTTTVSSTTSYVAERVVSPVIRVSGLLIGVRAAASFLARRGQK